MECKLDRITVHYEVFGEGKPILMLHGMSLDHTEMVYEMERYFTKRSGWKRIYLDMPGHGKTPGADWISSTDEILKVVEDFIDQVIPGERFVVAGTSYGAYIGRGLVHRRGAIMNGLLLSVPVIVPDRTKRILPPRVVLLKNQAIMDAARSENLSNEVDVFVVVQNRDVVDYLRALQASVADEKFLEKIWPQNGFSFDVDKLPQPFPAPTLFIMGRQDSVAGYRDAWNISENYARATFAILDRAGHLALGEQSQLCSDLIQDWLDRVEEWTTQIHS
ncbi:MAG TPA: alpha/beta hydrolase [Candidatus Dormibacteraeota bacterium]|nr:alpha/beta hydrolase [Candidatus Dormibacteraeota bacterium]